MRARRLVAAASVVVATMAFAGGAEAAASGGGSVSGSGRVTLSPEWGDVAGDPVLISVSADSRGRGTFHVLHLDDTGGVYARAVGEVTCVSVSGNVAVTTGIIRQAWFRDFPGWDVTGMAAAITVADGEEGDVIGFDFEFFGSTITPCQEVTPFAPVEHGNFTVR